MSFSTINIRTPAWHAVYYIEFETEIGFDALKTLISNQEASLKESQDKFKGIIENDANLNTLNPEEVGSYYSQMFDREEMIINELQKQQRYAICLSIFSFFEGRLKSICNLIEETFDHRIKIDDLNSYDDLMRYWNYMDKIFEIDTTKIEPFFTPIKQQKIIRNKIAHQSGLLTDQEVKKVNIVTGLKLNEQSNGLEINFSDSSYSLYLLDKMSSFFGELFNALDERYKQKSNPLKEQ